MTEVFGQTPTSGTAADADVTYQAPARTGLDFIRALRAEKKAAAVRTVVLRDTQRPEFELVCRVPSDMDEMLDLEDKAKTYAAEEGNPQLEVVLAAMGLARYTTVLRCNGLTVGQHDNGSPFADPALQEAVGTAGIPGASWRTVREVFITDGGVYDDGVIGRLSGRLSDESGMLRNTVVVGGDEDPT